MRSWRVTGGITIALVVACMAEATDMDSPQPNIVVLVTDDQRYDTIGYLRDRTAELSKLYGGLVFEDGFESGDLALWTVVN